MSDFLAGSENTPDYTKQSTHDTTVQEQLIINNHPLIVHTCSLHNANILQSFPTCR